MPDAECVAYTIAPMAVRLWGRSESSIERIGARSHTSLPPPQRPVASITAIRFAFATATYENMTACVYLGSAVVLVTVVVACCDVGDVVGAVVVEVAVAIPFGVAGLFALGAAVGDVTDVVHAPATSTRTAIAAVSRIP